MTPMLHMSTGVPYGVDLRISGATSTRTPKAQGKTWHRQRRPSQVPCRDERRKALELLDAPWLALSGIVHTRFTLLLSYALQFLLRRADLTRQAPNATLSSAQEKSHTLSHVRFKNRKAFRAL